MSNTTDNNELDQILKDLQTSWMYQSVNLPKGKTVLDAPREKAEQAIENWAAQAAYKAAEAARINGYKEALYDSCYGFDGKLESVENKLKAFNSEQEGETA